MAILSLLLALAAEWFLPELEKWRRTDWYERYHRLIEQQFGDRPFWDSPFGLLLLVGIPVVSLMVLQWLLSLILFGLPALLLAVVVLFLCLGPENLVRQVHEYLSAAEESSPVKALAVASEFTGTHSDEIEEANADMRDAVLADSNDRLFAVIFWFMVLGPVGALLYRLAVYARATESPVDDSRQQPEEAAAGTTGELFRPGGFGDAAERLHGILAWIPARLLALSYALVGSFDEALMAWRDQIRETGHSLLGNARAVLLAAGRGALHLDAGQAGPRCEARRVSSALSLVQRSMIVWLIMLAVLTLAGWVV